MVSIKTLSAPPFTVKGHLSERAAAAFSFIHGLSGLYGFSLE